MNKNLYLNKDFLYNKELGDAAISIMLALNGMIHEGCTDYYVNCTSIEYNLFGRSATTREHSRIKCGIEELIDKGYITLIDQITKRDYVLDLSKLIIDTDIDFYILITKDELRSIMNINTLLNKYKLVRLFACLIATFGNSDKLDLKYRGKIGFMSQSYICDIASISEQSISSYNNTLIENNLLYIASNCGKNKMVYDHNGILKISGIANTYSRFSDKDLCNEYSAKIKGANYHKKAQYSSDYSRKMKQKYNMILKGIQYSDIEIAEIFNFAVKYNKSIENGESKHKDILDLSIFNRLN